MDVHLDSCFHGKIYRHKQDISMVTLVFLFSFISCLLAIFWRYLIYVKLFSQFIKSKEGPCVMGTPLFYAIIKIVPHSGRKLFFFQDYTNPDDHNTRSTVTPGIKPFTLGLFFV